jgi:hypothetical protein
MAQIHIAMPLVEKVSPMAVWVELTMYRPQSRISWVVLAVVAERLLWITTKLMVVVVVDIPVVDAEEMQIRPAELVAVAAVAILLQEFIYLIHSTPATAT